MDMTTPLRVDESVGSTLDMNSAGWIYTVHLLFTS